MNVDPRVEQILDLEIKNEGGYVDNPHDKGGPTKYGNSLREAQKWGLELDIDGDGQVTAADIAQLTPEKAKAVYLKKYFVLPSFNYLPTEIQAQVVDTGVLSGPGRAAIILQEVLDQVRQTAPDLKLPVIKTDGSIGHVTEDAAAAAQKAMGPFLSNALVEARVVYLNHVADNNPADEDFRHGWIRRARSFQVAV